MLDINKLTLGETSKVEDLAGTSIGDLGEPGRPQSKLLAGLVFVLKRREQLAQGLPPTYTWNEALDMSQEDTATFLGLGDDEDADQVGEVPDAGPKEIEPSAPTRKKSAPKTKS